MQCDKKAPGGFVLSHHQCRGWGLLCRCHLHELGLVKGNAAYRFTPYPPELVAEVLLTEFGGPAVTNCIIP